MRAGQPPLLQVSGLTKEFGARRAVDQVDLAVHEGEFFCLLGPSGCGKTTLLRMIGGYHLPDAGQIMLAGQDVSRAPLEHRDIGMVFQSYALFPHLSARENVAFGLQARKIPRLERTRRTEDMLARVGLPDAVRDHRPRALSGGEQQRVALARALVLEPRLLLLDEPMASLDRRLRDTMRGELRELQRRTGVSVIMVTHDQEEALFLADRIAVMADGQLQQVGTADDLYNRPASPFVARFVGDANMLDPANPLVRACVTARPADHPGNETGGPVMVRPEHVLVATTPQSGAVDATVVCVTLLGADRLVELRLADGTPVLSRSRAIESPIPSRCERVFVAVRPEALWRFARQDHTAPERRWAG